MPCHSRLLLALPRPSPRAPQVISGVSQGWLRVTWPPQCHPAVAKLGDACMVLDALARPSFQEIGDVSLARCAPCAQPAQELRTPSPLAACARGDCFLDLDPRAFLAGAGGDRAERAQRAAVDHPPGAGALRPHDAARRPPAAVSWLRGGGRFAGARPPRFVARRARLFLPRRSLCRRECTGASREGVQGMALEGAEPLRVVRSGPGGCQLSAAAPPFMLSLAVVWHRRCAPVLPPGPGPLRACLVGGRCWRRLGRCPGEPVSSAL